MMTRTRFKDTGQNALLPRHAARPLRENVIMKDAAQLMQRAENCRDAGELEAAIECLEKIVDDDPLRVDAALEAAQIALTVEDNERAERLCSTALRADPGNATARLQRTHALCKLNRIAEARDELKVIVEMLPDLTEVYRYLGYAHYSLHEYDQAAAAFERVTQDIPDDAPAWLWFGDALSQSYTRYGEAMDVLANAVKLGADDEGLLISAADRLLLDGRYAEAEAALRQAMSTGRDVGNNPSPNAWLGYVLLGQDRRKEARQAYGRALKACEALIQKSPNIVAIVYRGLSAFMHYCLGHAGHVEMILNMFAESGVSPAEFVYGHDTYLPDTYRRIQRLTEIIGGRDVALLLYGPSITDLEQQIDTLADCDICFASVNKFDVVEQRILSRIGRRLDIVVTANPSDIQLRWDAYRDYLSRPDPNLLVATEYVLAGLRPPHSVEGQFVRCFDEKLLFFDAANRLPTTPVTPLHFSPGNTLSVALPMLAVGGARRIFIFGGDGGATPLHQEEQPPYFFDDKASADATRTAEMLRRLRNDAAVCDYNAPFAVMAASKIFRHRRPEIFNVCPYSAYRAFTKISCDNAVAMLREGV